MITRHRRGERDRETDNTLPLRNVLNIIFMLGAIVSVIVYLCGPQRTAIYIALGAMVFKIVESAIRFFHR